MTLKYRREIAKFLTKDELSIKTKEVLQILASLTEQEIQDKKHH